MKHALLVLLLLTKNLLSNATPIELEQFEQFSRNIITKVEKINIPKLPVVFNPSMIKTKELGTILTFRYSPEVKQMPWISHIGIVRLDEKFKPIGMPDLLKTRSKANPVPSQSEDARIIECAGKLYVIYNDNDEVMAPCGLDRRDMFIGEVLYEKGHFVMGSILKLFHNDKYSTVLVQKNWVPFAWKDSVLLAYSLNSHEIVVPNFSTGVCSTCFETSCDLNWRWGILRGGTPAQLVDGEYLAFFHSSISGSSEASMQNERWHYFMGAYTFSADPPFKITKVSPCPLVHKDFYTKDNAHKKVVFPGGFTISDNKIHVVYGKNDKEIWLTTIDKSALYQSLVPVARSKDYTSITSDIQIPEDRHENLKNWEVYEIIKPTAIKPARTAVLIIEAPVMGKRPIENRWKLGKKVWEQYMHSHPNVDCFFVQSVIPDENREQQVWLDDNTIYVGDEWFKNRRTDRILHKTVAAMEFLLPNYTHFIRTNLNTFINLNSVNRYVETHHESFYTAPLWESQWYTIGYGIIFTADVAKHIVTEYHRLSNENEPLIGPDHADDGALCALATGVWPYSDPHPFRCCPSLPRGVCQLMCEESYSTKRFSKYGLLLMPPITLEQAIRFCSAADDEMMLYRSRDGLELSEIAELYTFLMKKHYPGLLCPDLGEYVNFLNQN